MPSWVREQVLAVFARRGNRAPLQSTWVGYTADGRKVEVSDMLPAYPEDRRDDMNGKGENRKTSYAYKATPLRDATDLQYSNRPSPYRHAWAPPQHGGAPFSDRQKSGFAAGLKEYIILNTETQGTCF